MANWTEEEIQEVWEKGTIVAGVDSTKWRKDDCTAWIYRGAYGNRNSENGWEIDHIIAGGPDIMSNLRPLQWQNNVHKSDGRLKCKIVSDGNKNVEKGDTEKA